MISGLGCGSFDGLGRPGVTFFLI